MGTFFFLPLERFHSQKSTTHCQICNAVIKTLRSLNFHYLHGKQTSRIHLRYQAEHESAGPKQEAPVWSENAQPGFTSLCSAVSLRELEVYVTC